MEYTKEELEVIEDLHIINVIGQMCEIGEILEKQEIRKQAIHQINQLRDSQGHGNNLFQQLLSCEDRFYNYTRMNIHSFKKLLNFVHPFIKKEITGRTPISSEIRLAMTLRYLATGDSLVSTAYNYRVGISTAHNIVRETCNAIAISLKQYLKWPSEAEFLNIASEFEHLWRFPHCLGSIDGKHVRIINPRNAGSQYFNYKKYYSIVLLAVCDAKYRFIYTNIGAYGSQSDGGVFFNSSLGEAIDKGELSLPQPSDLPGSSIKFPYFFIGDEAFQLKPNLQRPYSGRMLPPIKEKYNAKFSSARKTIEDAFGQLVAKFRIYFTMINATPENVNSIIKATTVLHNFIKIENELLRIVDTDLCTVRSILEDLDQNNQAPNFNSASVTREAIIHRDIYANYLNERYP